MGPSAASDYHARRGEVEVVEPVCSPGAAYFSTILWVYKGGLNMFGVVMAGKTWHCADGVGESQSICLSVYNTTLLGLLNVGMHVLASDNIAAKSGVRSFTAVGGTVFTVSAVFGPKAYKVRTRMKLFARTWMDLSIALLFFHNVICGRAAVTFRFRPRQVAYQTNVFVLHI